MSIKVVDVTLRDGGCVNNFNFGQRYMNSILNDLSRAELDYIELGYIDEFKGSLSGRTQFIDESCIKNCFLKEKKPNIKYLAMIDFGKFDVNKLAKCNKDGIDGIRYCFHKKDYRKAIEDLKILISKGYDVYAQPMITLRYSNSELLDFLNMINSLDGIKGVYIVDSFGEMTETDVKRLFKIYNENLLPGISIGFHSHNNLQLAFSNGINFISMDCDRDLMIDSSVMGMGKGAGNLPTELILNFLNNHFSASYKISFIFSLIEKVISKLKLLYNWGYSLPYYLASINHCTPSYAAFFDKKQMLSVDQLNEILSLIPDDKKISFDEKFAENLYAKYNERNQINDINDIEKLKQIFKDKEIALIAPGFSILSYEKEINSILSKKDVVGVFLNIFNKNFKNVEYIITCRDDAIDCVKDSSLKIIATSNLNSRSCAKYVIDYKNNIVVEDNIIKDSSLAISLNLFKKVGVKTLYLIGFDGFTSDSSKNYFDFDYNKEILPSLSNEKNKINQKLIETFKKDFKIIFVTPSIYEKKN